MGVVRVNVGQQRGHVSRHPGAQVLGGQAVEVAAIMLKVKKKLKKNTLNSRHGLVDGLDAVSQSELVDNLLARLVKVNLPALLPLGVREVDLSSILITQIMEEVLMEARVLDVVRSDLDRRVMKNIITLAETFNVSNSNSLRVV